MNRIGKYLVHKVALTTGYARVLFCTDPDLRIPVAIKLFNAKDEGGLSPAQWMTRFQTEARALAMFDHPHIIGVKAYDSMDGIPFFVMPYQAANLPFEIGKDDPLNPNKLLRPRKSTLGRGLQLTKQIAAALALVHRRELVHRLVRPSNILLSARDRGQAKLADFSMVKTGERGVAFPDVWTGPTDYCAPEQLENAANVGPQADVYSLGLIAYRLFVGLAPSHGTAPLVVENVPAALSDLIYRSTQPEPSLRPAHAGAFLEELVSIKLPVSATPEVKIVGAKRPVLAAG